MSYQQIYINQDNLKFIHENYSDQIKALELFFKDACLSTIDENAVKFGADTVISSINKIDNLFIIIPLGVIVGNRN